MQIPEFAPQPLDIHPPAAKDASDPAPVSVWERHRDPGGAGHAGRHSAAVPHPAPQPLWVPGGLPTTVRQTKREKERERECILSWKIEKCCIFTFILTVLFHSDCSATAFSPACQNSVFWTESQSCQKIPCRLTFLQHQDCAPFCDTLGCELTVKKQENAPYLFGQNQEKPSKCTKFYIQYYVHRIKNTFL